MGGIGWVGRNRLDQKEYVGLEVKGWIRRNRLDWEGKVGLKGILEFLKVSLIIKQVLFLVNTFCEGFSSDQLFKIHLRRLFWKI